MNRIKELAVKYKNIKPLYRFAVNGLLLYILWIVFYEFFRYVPFVDFIYNDVTYHLTNSWLYSTKFFMNITGHEATIDISRKLIVLEGTPGVILERGCLGRNMMGLFVGFILVYPGSIKTKLWYIPFGLGIIYILNVLRIGGLSYTQLYFPEYLDVNHHTVFKYTVYAAIFFLWAFWISKVNKQHNEKQTDEKNKQQDEAKVVTKPIS